MNQKPLDQQDRDWEKGNCYYVTLEFMKDSDHLRSKGIENCTLVHGHVTANGKEMKHAWVEVNGESVLELSNGNNLSLPITEYYQKFSAKACIRLIRTEADALVSDPKFGVSYWGDLNKTDVDSAVLALTPENSEFARGTIFSDPTDEANRLKLNLKS